MAAGTEAKSLHLYLRALREAKPRWPALGAVFLLGLIWTPISLLLPLPVKIILDHVTGSEPIPEWLSMLSLGGGDERQAALVTALALSVAVTLLVLIHNTADWLLREHLAETIVRDARQRLISKSLELSALATKSEGAQDLNNRVIHDAPAMQWVTLYGLMPIVTSAASLLTLVVVTSQLSIPIAVLALVTSVPLVAIIHRNQWRMRDGWHGVKERDAKALAHAQDTLTAWRVVVVSGQERRMVDGFEGLARSASRAKLKVMGLQALMGSLMTFGVALGTAAILYMAVQDVRAGTLTPGDLMLVITYVGQLFGPIQTIVGHMASQQSALASVERNFALMDQEAPIRDGPGALPVASAQGDLEFRNVSFGYQPSHLVIRDCSFRIPARSWVGISGPSGAGKTTVANLFVRLLDPTAGNVLLDGRDLRDYRLEDLRRQFALLGQDCPLLSGSIERNIAFACPAATRPEIVEAAKRAQAHDFISALPEGYDTLVGDGGRELSGGQRQRIALARTYLRDAPILILDEPTSALDVSTEMAAIADLKRNLSGRTVLVITHRPSVLEAADLVLQVDRGETRMLTRQEFLSDTPNLLVA